MITESATHTSSPPHSTLKHKTRMWRMLSASEGKRTSNRGLRGSPIVEVSAVRWSRPLWTAQTWGRVFLPSRDLLVLSFEWTRRGLSLCGQFNYLRFASRLSLNTLVLPRSPALHLVASSASWTPCTRQGSCLCSRRSLRILPISNRPLYTVV